MPAKNSGDTKKTRRPTKRGTKSGDARRESEVASETPENSADPAAKRFIRDLLIRGEAVEPAEDGSLPPGATHTIVEEGEDGQIKVKRERFSLY